MFVAIPAMTFRRVRAAGSETRTAAAEDQAMVSPDSSHADTFERLFHRGAQQGITLGHGRVGLFGCLLFVRGALRLRRLDQRLYCGIEILVRANQFAVRLAQLGYGCGR